MESSVDKREAEHDDRERPNAVDGKRLGEILGTSGVYYDNLTQRLADFEKLKRVFVEML